MGRFMSSSYEGLSKRAKMWILTLSAIVAVSNLGLAWLVASNAIEQIPFSNDDIALIVGLSADVTDSRIQANNIQLRTHAINTQVHLKGVTNKQAISVVAIGSGFAMMSIGFALFLIGADGAFTLKATEGDRNLVFSSTAPGLLCFLLASILIIYAITRDYEINLGSSQYVSTAGQTTIQPRPVINP